MGNQEKNKGGRPSLYSAELITEICARLSKGEVMTQICRDEGMPAARTIREWTESRPDVSAAIARAREEGFDAIALDALNIADDGSRDYEVNDDGRAAIDRDHIQRSKLRVETRLKLLAKWDPKRYGDKIQQEVSGPDGGPIETRDLSKLDDAELDARLAKLRDAT